MKKLIILLLFSTAAHAAWSQDDEEVVADSVAYSFEVDTTSYYYDEEADHSASTINPVDAAPTKDYKNADVPLKKFDQEKWKKVVGNENFQEKEIKIDPPKERKPWNFRGLRIGADLLRVLAYAVVFAAFAFILYYIAQNLTIKQKIKSVKVVNVTAPVENIEEIELDGILRHAMADGDLRLAVRIYYLQLLKKLNEVGLIIWKKDKTNRDYLSELYGHDNVYDGVRKLTLAYELVWYGERPVSPESFESIRVDFESINKNVENAKAAG